MDIAVFPFKISHLVDGEWAEYLHPNHFLEEPTDRRSRLVIGSRTSPIELIKRLAEELSPPLRLLLVLHTPRLSEPGRYESDELDLQAVTQFLDRFRFALEKDARFDIWVDSPQTESTLVLDKHNLIFAYGDLERFREILREKGFIEEEFDLPFPHSHHFSEAFDDDERSMVSDYKWFMSPLQPGDGD